MISSLNMDQQENDDKILIQMKQIAKQPKKQLPKDLIHSFAALTFFHQAIRIALDDINDQLLSYKKTEDPLLPSKIYKYFEDLCICIDLHKEHDLDGLFPEIESSITNQINDRIFEHQNEEELNESLTKLSEIIEKHNKDSELITQVKYLMVAFVDKVEDNANKLDEIQLSFETLSNSFETWMDYHLVLLHQEDAFLADVIDHIAENKIAEMRIIKGILDGTFHLILQYQLQFTVSKLSKCADWICPINKQCYVDNQALATYIHSLRLICTEEEYESVRKQIQGIVSAEIWEEMKLYGLDKPGLFRYRKTTVLETPRHFGCYDGEKFDCHCTIL